MEEFEIDESQLIAFFIVQPYILPDILNMSLAVVKNYICQEMEKDPNFWNNCLEGSSSIPGSGEELRAKAFKNIEFLFSKDD